MSMLSQVRLLALHKSQNNDATLFRLCKGFNLHFVLGAELTDKVVRVFTNHPDASKYGPNRHKYRELKWQNLSAHESDVYDIFAECFMVLSGSFNYYFTVDGSDQKENAEGHGYFLVDPNLSYGKLDEKMPLDSICCQTVLSKNLGPLKEWEDRLRVSKESGYNMIHFTPIQELGKSNSAYALKDQLRLNPIFGEGHDVEPTYDDMEKLVSMMRDEWGILSLTDLVFNHTANESPWIQEHPECAYNLVNSPHLKPAYLLDRILWHFSLDVGEGKWEHSGVPECLDSEDHLNAIWHTLWEKVIPNYHLAEYYQAGIEEVIQQFKSAVWSGIHGDDCSGSSLVLIPDPKFRRLKATVNIPLAINLCHEIQPRDISEDSRIAASCDMLREKLQQLNDAKFKEIEGHMMAAVDNVVANARYRFVSQDGPRNGKVYDEQPIMWNYFTLPAKRMSVEQEEAVMNTEGGAYCMAHNGWVMNDDPLRNFAEPGSNIYLRRELIPWGDSVKLRYGRSPEDCPFLWQQMRQYVVETARVFHGVRLDNCHSTPIHVAEYMLDEARKVRPDLYVIAELFTSSEYKDNIFINRLGLTSLIREGLSAGSSQDLGHLIHRYGGNPVGAFIQQPARPLMSTGAHAIFMDQTHDNPSPVEKRTALDMLPSAALVSMACCATGSNRGYDELVPHHINVVTEPRRYQTWSSEAKLACGHVNQDSGIISAKNALNKMHKHLGDAGFNQIYVDQVDQDIVSVTRHNPISHQSVIVVARTVFGQPSNMHTGQIPMLVVPGHVNEILLEAKITSKSGDEDFSKNEDFINGLPNYSLYLKEHITIAESNLVELRESSKKSVQEFDFVDFPPGSVLAVSVSLNTPTKTAVLAVRQTLSQFGYRMHTLSARNIESITGTALEDFATKLSMNDLNRILFRCNGEEVDDGKGFGAYGIPGSNDLPYCGLQGVMHVLSNIRAANDLGHPMCENLRNGDWLMDYTANRLKAYDGTKELGEWFAAVFDHLKQLPRYLIPCYFDAIITGVFMIVEEIAWAKMSIFVSRGSSFVRALGMGCLQFCSVVPTARLPILSPNLAAPHPASITSETGQKEQACATLCAGLPHFASGIWRNWGRDTFIAIRGILLLPGRHEDARYIILAYAGCLRHGLIPNLLGSGTSARYNCRDAVWFWLQAVQDYCLLVPNGTDILKDKVSRMYPTDDAAPESPGICDQPLHDVLQEALQRHADGIQYRERHAGRDIDNDMSDPGFNVTIGIDWETGFVYGGNKHNCGTWMDKMGSSEKAGNKGKPATPRDGSAVELVGLCKSTVTWLADMAGKGHYPYDGVSTKDGSGESCKVTFASWASLIQLHFEEYFWVNTTQTPTEQHSNFVNKRGIYKDSVGSSLPWTDFQLRPNFPISMVVAPELFSPEKAWTALDAAGKNLLGPLGMKTLDNSDWNYNGFYINSDDSTDGNKANGFNYHQGPEWLWPVGFYLRARLIFGKKLEASQPGSMSQALRMVKTVLSRHNAHMQSSEWKSLPELTNQNGAVCPDSCEAQAWSVGCILEVLYDMEHLQ